MKCLHNFTGIMKISTICIRNSSWMVIGSYASIVLLPFTPDLDLGLLILLLLRAELLLLVFVWARVLISVVAGRMIGASFWFCCDGPLLRAGDRCVF